MEVKEFDPHDTVDARRNAALRFGQFLFRNDSTLPDRIDFGLVEPGTRPGTDNS